MTSMEAKPTEEEVGYALGYLDAKIGSVDEEPKIDKEAMRRVRDVLARLAGHDS